MKNPNLSNQDAIEHFATGEQKTIKDLMQLRTTEIPVLEVRDPLLKSGGGTKHYTYTIRGTDS
jgi:hypothetical protein